MTKLIELLNQVYSGGFSFQKEVVIPVIRQKTSVTLVVTAKSPTNFSFTHKSTGGSVKFDKGPLITIKEFGIQTTLTGIEITKDTAIFQLSGFPDQTYTFPK